MSFNIETCNDNKHKLVGVKYDQRTYCSNMHGFVGALLVLYNTITLADSAPELQLSHERVSMLIITPNRHGNDTTG